ncbi:acetate--CoA ligase family protein [Brevibacterium sp. RIT 803]|uniref:acetate--CoA ligase family protein n=1 Tax=Brevibacterium sp. RIT 803 TaxID=2810210 RepID=UPI00194FE653|nr:acetate--CoA ligase family protein [Brevibacterium sp. RIT 803]MBM6592241.1 acetate--CoA ligase family protein [Brevibacterium sp. RIT 803]
MRLNTSSPAQPSSPGTHVLDRALRPHSVAIVGASDDTSRISGRALHYLKSACFTGRIFAINPKRDIVQGLPAYPSLADVPETPDIALICLGAAHLRQAIIDCAEVGIGAAVIFAAGFAETGEEGIVAQREIEELAREGGVRLFGPNCLGVMNSAIGFMGTFSSAFDGQAPAPGGIAIVSQSGAYGGHLAYLCAKRNMGVSYWISTGNESDVDVAECIDWLATQNDVSVILAYAEGVQEGARFTNALETARRNRTPVVFMKVGESPLGAHAAQSHTASLAGEDKVFDAALRQYGAYRARTTQEQIDVAYACSRRIYPAGRNLGVVTVSGGFGVQLCDAADRHELYVSPLAEQGRAKLREINPMGSDNNPCDTTANWLNDPSLITQTLNVMYAEGGYDSIIAALTMLPDTQHAGERVREAITAGTTNFLDRPTLLCMEARDSVIKAYEEDGFLVFDDAERATVALSALSYFVEEWASPRTRSTKAGDGTALGAVALSEAAARSTLASAGIPFLPAEVASTSDELAATTVRMSGPYAIKIVSADIAHKTEIGGVVLDVPDAAAAETARQDIFARTATLMPDAQVEGVLVSPMAPEGIEVIIGVTNDPIFGPVTMFGLGGTEAELFEDVALRIGRISADEAAAMIAETRSSALLDGYRGNPAGDRAALAEAIAALSEFGAAHADQLDSVEINPLLVLPPGEGVIALDALIVPPRREQVL